MSVNDLAMSVDFVVAKIIRYVENLAVLAMRPRTVQKAKMNINAFTVGKKIISQEATPVKKCKKNIRFLSKDVKMHPNIIKKEEKIN